MQDCFIDINFSCLLFKICESVNSTSINDLANDMKASCKQISAIEKNQTKEKDECSVGKGTHSNKAFSPSHPPELSGLIGHHMKIIFNSTNYCEKIVCRGGGGQSNKIRKFQLTCSLKHFHIFSVHCMQAVGERVHSRGGAVQGNPFQL